MKIKYEIIQKFYNLTSKEMDLLLYMVKCQDQATGMVEGVYYLDAMKNAGMCKQSFYNALQGLEEKKVISVQKNSDVDYDVCIIGNAFPSREVFQEGYVSLNRKAFHKKSFRKLKAHEKYLVLEFLKRTHENGHSYCIGVKKFYEQFRDILKVSERVLRGYLHKLKEFFSIGIKNGKYYITYLHSVFQKLRPGDSEWRSEERQTYSQLVRKECHRLHIAYEQPALEDTVIQIGQYREWTDSTREMLRLLMDCIRESIEGIRYSERKLQNKYIHKLVKKALGVPETVKK